MKITDFVTIILFFTVLIAALPLLGEYMAKVFTGQRNILSPVFGKLEKGFYGFSGIQPEKEMNYKEYLAALFIFNFIGGVILFLILVAQKYLPFNPQHLDGVPFWLHTPERIH